MSLKMKSLIYKNESEKLMNGPLCEWLFKCLDLQIQTQDVTYSDLVDGMMIHQVFLMTDLNVVTKDIIEPNGDPVQRLENLRAIMDNIQYFFEEEYKFLIVQVPKIHLLAEKPMSNTKEMELLLKLLFGCTLKCPQISIFIKIMEKCKETTQMELIKYANEMNERCDIIFDPELVLKEDFHKSSLYEAFIYIRSVYKENIICQREHSDFECNTKEKLEETQEDLQNLNIKFQKVKCELKDVKEYMYQNETYVNNLKKENQILEKEAAIARKLRDELDIAKEELQKAKDIIKQLNKKARSPINLFEHSKYLAIKTNETQLKDEARCTKLQIENLCKKNKCLQKEIQKLQEKKDKNKNDLEIELEKKQRQVQDYKNICEKLLKENASLQNKHKNLISQFLFQKKHYFK